MKKWIPRPVFHHVDKYDQSSFKASFDMMQGNNSFIGFFSYLYHKISDITGAVRAISHEYCFVSEYHKCKFDFIQKFSN